MKRAVDVSMGILVGFLLAFFLLKSGSDHASEPGHGHPALPKPADSTPAAGSASEPGPLPQTSPSAPAPKPKEDPGLLARAEEPYTLGWRRNPRNAVVEWGKQWRTPQEKNSQELLRELDRILALPGGVEKTDAVRDLFYKQSILDRAVTNRLLAAYDEHGSGTDLARNMRDVLFASLLFSEDGEYVSQKLLARAVGQNPDDRQHFFLSVLPGHHEEIWSLLCDDVLGCRTEEGTRSAGLAMYCMVGAYGIEKGHATFARRMRELALGCRWPEGRRYLYQTMIRAAQETKGSHELRSRLFDEARGAFASETDPEVRKTIHDQDPTFPK